MIQEYKVKIGAYTDELKKVVNEAKGEIQKLNDNEILIRFDYDGNLKEYNNLITSLMKAAPELTIQFQYDVNKKLLDQELKKLEDLESLKLDIDSGLADKKIKDLLKEIQDLAFDDVGDFPILKSKTEYLVRYAKTLSEMGASIDDSFLIDLEDMDDDIKDFYGKSIRSILNEYDKSSETLFKINGSIEKTIADTKGNVESISKLLDKLKAAGAIDLSAGQGEGTGEGTGEGNGTGAEEGGGDTSKQADDIEELTEKVEVLTQKISEMRQELSTLSGEPFNEMAVSVQKLEEELSSAIAQLKELKDSGITFGEATVSASGKTTNENQDSSVVPTLTKKEIDKQAKYYDSVWEGLYDKQKKDREKLEAFNESVIEKQNALQRKLDKEQEKYRESVIEKQNALQRKLDKEQEKYRESVIEKQNAANRKAIKDEEKFRESVLYGQAKKRLSDEKKEEKRQVSAKESVGKLLRNTDYYLDDTKYLSDFLDKAKELQGILNDLNMLDIINEDDLKSAKLQFEELSKEALKLENQIVDPTKKIKLLNEIDQYSQKYSGLSKSTRDSLSQLAKSVENVENKSQLKELYNDFVKIQMAARDAGEETQSMFGTIGNRLKDMNAKFIAQFLSWQDMIRYARELASNVVAIDSALTELRKVSDASTERLSQSFEKSANTAMELGQSIEHVINVTADWSRLGYDVDAAEELARVTALFTTVGDNMTADDASSYLISTLQGYQLSADQALDIVDKYNQVANKFAIDTAGIGEALQRSAASFNAANTDLSKSIALITATNEVIQNPESVGTLWKTLSARIRGAKTELEELGEETDAYTETTSNLRDLVKSLTGFDIMKNENEYKDIYEIILGIGEAWENLSDIEQASLGEALAGKRNYNALMAVMGNLDTLKKAYKEAEQAAGSAEREQENYAKSIQYSLDRFQASVEKISYSLLNSDFLKSMVESGVSLLEILDSLISKSNGLVSILSGAGAGFGFIKAGGLDVFDGLIKNYKSLNGAIADYNKAISKSMIHGNAYIASIEGTNDALAQYLKNLNGAPATIRGYISSLIKTKAATIGVELATAAMNAVITAGISILTSLVVTEISKIITSAKEAREAAFELSEAYASESQSLEEQITEYQELSTELEEAIKKGEDTYSIKEQLASLQDTLNKAYGDEYEKVNLVNGAYTDQINILKNLSKEKANDFLSKNANQFDDMNEYLEKIRTYELGIFSPASNPTLKNDLKEIFDKYEGLDIKEDNLWWNSISLKANIEDADKIMQDLYAELEAYGKTHDLDVSWLTDSIAKERSKIAKDEEYSGYKQLRESYINASIAFNDELSNSFNEAIDAVDNYNNALESGEGVEAAKNNLDKIKTQIENMEFDSDGIKDKFLAIFDGIDDELEKRHIIDEAFASNDNDFMEYAERLKGLTELDLTNLSDSKTKATFNYLLHSLGLTEKNAGLLIDKLVELGIVQRGVAQSAKEMSDAEAEWTTERDKALDKLGLRKETSSGVEYDESWTDYLETIKALNPEIADNAVEVEKCALANMQFSKAVEDLSKNFKTYKEALKDADTLTPEYSEAINALADDLTYLTGIEFSLEDAASFLSSAENVKLLEEALNGSDKALQQLQERAAEGITIKIDTSSTDELREVIQAHLSELPDEYQLRLNLDSESFNAEIDNFANWLNENSDMGEIDVYALLETSPFMQALSTLMSESSEVATAVKKMFADLGWEVKWDTKKMPIPTGSKITSLYIPNDVDPEIRAKYTNASGGAVKWDYVDVPTNIQYVPKGKGKTTSTSKYTPTSLSPAQKSTAKTNIDKANGSSKDKEDDYKEFIDYFERMIKVLDQSVDLLEAHLEDVVGSFAKNSLLDAEEDLIQSKMNGYSSAIDMYSKKASEALSKIPSDIAEKLQNGAIDIDEFIGEGNKDVVEAIQEYEQWADKVAECKQQLVELKEAIRQLELQKFNNVMKDFTDAIDLRKSSGIDLIQKQMELFTEAGQLLGESFYTKSIEQQKKILSSLQNEQSALVKQLNEALSKGVDTGSDEWIEMQNALIEVEGSIIDCRKEIESLDNALLELHTEVFNKIQNQFAAFADELSNMQELISDEASPVATVKNEWTTEGLAQLGLLTQQYELAEYQVKQYSEEIERLNQAYLEGRYSTTEYMEKLIELKNAQWSAVEASESALSSIRQLNEERVNIVVEGINEEIEAYEKYTQSILDNLSAEKELHDYQKQIADENKAIVDIQRQLAAIQDDDSQAARAKRAKLEEQLKEAQDTLNETEYSHSIDAQQDALDKQLEQYKETRQAEIDALQESLLNVEQILSDTFEAVRANSQLIGETIVAQAQAHGIEMSQALTDAWFAGENAIAHYGEVLTAASSNFIGEIQGVEFEVYELQNQANVTSESLANMFATRADNLVEELVRSYTSEYNLDQMTNALHDSLSNTIDGSYSGGSAVSALNSIASAADGVADSARAAASALADLVKAQQDTSSKTTTYTVKDSSGRTLWSGTSKEAAEAQKNWYGGGGVHVEHNAKGNRRVSKDTLSWVNENGPEMIVSPSTGAILTPLKKGDAVLPTDQTSNIWEWSRFDPEEFANKLVQSIDNVGTGNVQTNTMQVGSLVTVNGNVNDSMAMMEIASTTASTKIKQSFKELSNNLNK